MRSISLFSDPPNRQEILERLQTLQGETLISYVKEIFPNWILTTSPQFSIDLYKFNEQWAFACANLNIEPHYVVIVHETYLDLQSTTHTLIGEVCKRMTETGFVVIDSINFDVCRYCKEVIVSEKRVVEHHRMWKGACQRCLKK